jgi:hypothetical protein
MCCTVMLAARPFQDFDLRREGSGELWKACPAFYGAMLSLWASRHAEVMVAGVKGGHQCREHRFNLVHRGAMLVAYLPS